MVLVVAGRHSRNRDLFVGRRQQGEICSSTGLGLISGGRPVGLLEVIGQPMPCRIGQETSGKSADFWRQPDHSWDQHLADQAT